MRRSLTKTIKIILLGVALFSAFAAAALAQSEQSATLAAADFENGKSVNLSDSPWKYRAGDDGAWAAVDFDDRNWQSLSNRQINEDLSSLEGWEGRAWFRRKIAVDENIAGKPLAFRFWHWGATEIYLDGKLVKKYGEILENGEIEYNPHGTAFPVAFGSGGEHVVAVRYSFAAGRDLTRGNWLVRGGNLPGFRLYVEAWEKYARRLDTQKSEARIDYSFIGLFAAFALIHFLLFVFYRAAPGNLFYSFFVVGLALSFLLQNLLGNEHFGATAALVVDIVRLNVQALAILALLAFLYVEFETRPSRFFWLLLAVWAIEIVLSAVQVWRDSTHFLVLLFVTFGDCVRIMIRALKRERDGAWIIATGVVLLVAGVMINIARERQWIEIPDWLYSMNLYTAVFSVPLTVSIYLARNFARANRNLEAQLEQIKDLSARQIEQERQTAELRLEHERTHAENERRARELEEARQLQLSMLPKRLPELPGLEIAAYMKPATEVGGDYYDFHVAADGTLTVAVGDATGHGLKAGTLVTATKSLFNAFAAEKSAPEILSAMSVAIKKMNLRGLFMAMAMLKIRNGAATLSIAGMPPVLVYRAAVHAVEEIAERAVPLGAMAKTLYREREITLARGDLIVLMSDGFPEMFNPDGEMLGFEKAGAVLPEIAHLTAPEIVDALVRIADEWAAGRAPEDDVTFVVLKIV